MPRILIGLILAFAATSVSAETVFVTDELRLAMRDTPDTKTAPTAILVAGAKLELLERDGDYLRVRTEDDKEGWVHKNYITEEAPARVRIVSLEAEHGALQEQVAEVRVRADQLGSENQALAGELQTLKQQHALLVDEAESLRDRVGDSREREQRRMLLLAGGTLVVLLGGFLWGAIWERRRTSRRLGGLRI